MERRYIYLLGIFIMLFLSCSNNYEFWDISKFNIDQNALRNSSKVKIIYCSLGPDIPVNFENSKDVITYTHNGKVMYYKKTDFYVHYVVLDITQKDTLNVLVPEAIDISISDWKNTFLYSRKDYELKGPMYSMKNLENLKAGDIINEREYTLPNYDKVARDPNFDQVADNEYKTVIGYINRLQ